MLLPEHTAEIVRLQLDDFVLSSLHSTDDVQIVVSAQETSKGLGRKASTSLLDPKKAYAVAIILGQLRVRLSRRE